MKKYTEYEIYAAFEEWFEDRKENPNDFAELDSEEYTPENCAEHLILCMDEQRRKA